MELKPLQRSGPAAVWFPLLLVLFGFPCRWCCLVSLGAGAAWFPLVPHAAASVIWFALLTHTSQHERCWYLHSVVALLVPFHCWYYVQLVYLIYTPINYLLHCRFLLLPLLFDAVSYEYLSLAQQDIDGRIRKPTGSPQ